MNKIIFFSAFTVGILSAGSLVNYANAKVTQAVCNGNQLVNTTILMDKGKWVGASIKTTNGEIEDAPPQKIKLGSINFNFKFKSKMKSFRVSTWRKYNGNTMEGRISDTGWKNCN